MPIRSQRAVLMKSTWPNISRTVRLRNLWALAARKADGRHHEVDQAYRDKAKQRLTGRPIERVCSACRRLSLPNAAILLALRVNLWPIVPVRTNMRMSADLAKPFDRELLRQRRNRVAMAADRHDFLLRRVTEDICERVQIVQRDFPKVLNLGAQTGVLSRSLRKLPNVSFVVDADHCEGLLAHCDGPCVVCDEEAISFGDGDLDLVVSGLSLQFVNDLPGTLVQIRRALKPDGLLLATLLGGETLKELRQAWFLAEEEITGGASPRVAPFIDVRALGGLSQRAQFALPVVDSEVLKVTYKTPLAVMEDLRAMGASNVLSARRPVPVTRPLLLRACELYEDLFATSDGLIPATFEFLTLTAWVPDASQPKPLKPGSAEVSLEKVLGKNQSR